MIVLYDTLRLMHLISI